MSIREEIVHDLLQIKAVQINPENQFTWTSGIKSPIYCDNRLTMSYPEVRKKIVKAFVQIIEENGLKPDVIAGCATAGIPHAAWISEALDLPMVYVRSKPKGHGKGNQIEGALKEGQRVVVIEDLISTGGSSINAADAIKAFGAEVVSVLAIFSYNLKETAGRFEKAGYPLETITNVDKLLEALVQTGKLSNEQKSSVAEWRNNLTFSEK